MRDRGIARHGYPVLDRRAAPTGRRHLRGTMSPTLGTAIAMAYVAAGGCRTRYDAGRRGSRARRSPPRSCRSRSTSAGLTATSRSTAAAARRDAPDHQGGPPDGPRRPALYQGARVGPRRGRRGDHRITQYAADQLGDIVFVELPAVGKALEQFATFGVVESVKAVSDLYAPGRGRGLGINDALADKPGARQQRAVRRRLDGPGAARRSGAGRRPARRRRPTSASSPRADRCPTARTSPTIEPGCSSAIGIDLGRRPVRGHPGTPAREPAAARPARSPSSSSAAAGRARRRATGSTSRLPGRGRIPPLDAAGRRPAAAAGGVVHGLHAVPARGQPGHAPEHLRVPVAARGSPGSTSCPRRTTTAARRPPRRR